MNECRPTVEVLEEKRRKEERQDQLIPSVPTQTFLYQLLQRLKVSTLTSLIVKMTRHGRNNTASACYTYHERQRDAKASGYGTLKARLGKESVKDFDACCLTLQPCRNPVIT